MNTKVAIVLPDMSQSKASTSCLRLLCQVPLDIPVFTKPSLLGKRHIIVKVPWLIYYWVIDKDTRAKVSPTPVKSMASSLDASSAHKNLKLILIGYLELQH